MLKSSLTTNVIARKAPEISKYPCLMESTKTMCIILLVSEKNGFVIHDIGNVNGNPVGTHSANWDMTKFKPFHGTVEITT